jgi:hypothetical protein
MTVRREPSREPDLSKTKLGLEPRLPRLQICALMRRMSEFFINNVAALGT